MSDEQLAPVIGSWLKNRDVSPPDALQSVGHLMARVPQTRQRRRWWPLPFLQRKQVPAHGISAVNGGPHTVTVRTIPTFSVSKVAAAAVIVALFGSVLLIARPFEQRGVSIPGASTGGPGTFSPAGSLAQARKLHTATVLPDGRVLIVGGLDGDASLLASAEVWDPATASFEPTGSLTEARHEHSATLLSDGRVLIVGGGDADRSLVSAEVWDPATASFGPAGSLTERRGGHSATLLSDGRVLIVGGSRIYGVAHAELMEVWDPETASFGPVVSRDEGRFGHSVTLLPDGRVLIVGGEGYSETADAQFEPPVEVWDPVTASFSAAGSLTEGRGGHTATLLPDGRILIVGGHDVSNTARYGVRRTSAEVWDPVTASFSPAGSLAEARSGHASALLPDGRVLIVTGSYWEPNTDDSVTITTAEVWDPARASFSPAGSLAEARSDNTTTLLPDGRVLVVGGEDDDGVLASAEVWALAEA